MSLIFMENSSFEWGVFPSHISLAAFIDGYLDIIVYEKFGVYCTMMTGNLIALGVSIINANTQNAVFLFTLIISYICGYYSFLLLNKFLGNSKHYTYLAIIPCQLLGVIIITFVADDFIGWMKCCVLPLVFAYGLVNGWATKYGYVPGMMTGNIQKLIDVFFKYLHTASTMSPKESGDFIVLLLELISYFIGVVIASILIRYSKGNSFGLNNGPLLVVLLAVPLKPIFSRSVFHLPTVIPCTENGTSEV